MECCHWAGLPTTRALPTGTCLRRGRTPDNTMRRPLGKRRPRLTPKAGRMRAGFDRLAGRAQQGQRSQANQVREPSAAMTPKLWHQGRPRQHNADTSRNSKKQSLQAKALCHKGNKASSIDAPPRENTSKLMSPPSQRTPRHTQACPEPGALRNAGRAEPFLSGPESPTLCWMQAWRRHELPEVDNPLQRDNSSCQSGRLGQSWRPWSSTPAGYPCN